LGDFGTRRFSLQGFFSWFSLKATVLAFIPRMIDLYNILLEKNAPDMIRAATPVRAAMQNAQTLNVVRLKASQMLSASEGEVTLV
jgi:hypothetical protein